MAGVQLPSISSYNYSSIKPSALIATMHFVSISQFKFPLRRDRHKRKQPSSPLLLLPTEIHLEIVKHLDVPTIFCLQLVNRYFYQLIPPMHKSELTEDNIAGIRAQLQDKRLCWKCIQFRPLGSFPQLVGSTPAETLAPNGWLGRCKQAWDNKHRTSKQDALMKRYGLLCPSPISYGGGLPVPGSWADNSHERSKLQWENGAKDVQSRQPRGGWVHIGRKRNHLFEYRGTCGWICRGLFPIHIKWIFRCECRRCSPVASESHNICCWCDPTDSRYCLLTPALNERWRGAFYDSYVPQVKDPGRILFRTKFLPYGTETSWVGRRMNTCEKYMDYKEWWGNSESPSSQWWGPRWSFWDGRAKWEADDVPTWEFTLCGVCGQWYTPGPNSRKKRDHERPDDFFKWGFKQCHRYCVPHVSDPGYSENTFWLGPHWRY